MNKIVLDKIRYFGEMSF